MFKQTTRGICGLITICCTLFCIYQYELDEDVARIEFAEFNSNENHIYPTVTMCIPNPLLEKKLVTYGDGINVSSYTDFVGGYLWDERMLYIDYDDVSIYIANYLLGKRFDS